MASSSSQGQSLDKVLIFGGNGFIGGEFVHRLIQSKQYNISIVSRGNSYFDFETRIKPFVNHFVCDRENSDMEYCTELMELIQKNLFKFVVDFSAYKPEVLEESLKILNDKTDLYVYISTDSVYEVSENRTAANGGLSREMDAIRPTSEEEKDRLNDLDEYGHEKLQGEEVLVSNRAAGGCPYLIVRFPDVIGPRDNTGRIWTYILWMQLFNYIKVPVFVPRHVQDLKTSFLYVNDAARAILHLINSGIKDDIFNVGFQEVFTLKEFLESLVQEIGQEIQLDFTASQSYNLFPSVTKGGIDVSKLAKTGFVPTDFKNAIHESVSFYKEAFYTFESERDDVVHELTKYVIGRERKGEFLNYIEKLAATKTKTESEEPRRTEL